MVDTTGISIFIESRLRDDGGTMMEHLCDEIDRLRCPIGHHDSLRTDSQLLGNHLLKGTRLWLRIVVDDIKVCFQMLL